MNGCSCEATPRHCRPTNADNYAQRLLGGHRGEQMKHMGLRRVACNSTSKASKQTKGKGIHDPGRRSAPDIGAPSNIRNSPKQRLDFLTSLQLLLSELANSVCVEALSKLFGSKDAQQSPWVSGGVKIVQNLKTFHFELSTLRKELHGTKRTS